MHTSPFLVRLNLPLSLSNLPSQSKQPFYSSESTTLKKLSSIPSQQEIDAFFKASAPEPDLLGDVDGFGLYAKFRAVPTLRLSELLESYYLGSQVQEPGMRNRWMTFVDAVNFGEDYSLVSLEPGSNGNIIPVLKSEAILQNEFVPRINNFNNLYSDGVGRSNNFFIRDWNYTGTMFSRFLDYVRSQIASL